jgi:chromosomal replication initiation ATPase DnaA
MMGRRSFIIGVIEGRRWRDRSARVAGRMRDIPGQLSTLAHVTAREYGVKAKDIRGKSRVRQFVMPRQKVMAIALDMGYSSTMVGRFLGGRDHSSVLHGAARHKERVANGGA